jgi:hypothetical protein
MSRKTVLVILGGMVGLTYLRVIRPWQLRWGATDDEVAQKFPGDEVVANPTFNATRGITVRAQPGEIWPWLVQMGLTRAGWYSYDWLDNLGRPSVRRILPEWQQPTVGDVVPMSPDGKQGQRVKAFETERWLLWGDERGTSTWCWLLQPVDADRTRLLTRVRMHYHWTSPAILFDLLVEIMDIVMVRKTLLGIRERAEEGSRDANEVPIVPR